MLINRPRSLIVAPTYFTGSSYAEGFAVTDVYAPRVGAARSCWAELDAVNHRRSSHFRRSGMVRESVDHVTDVASSFGAPKPFLLPIFLPSHH